MKTGFLIPDIYSTASMTVVEDISGSETNGGFAEAAAKTLRRAGISL
jgi:hypothetical protein